MHVIQVLQIVGWGRPDSKKPDARVATHEARQVCSVKIVDRKVGWAYALDILFSSYTTKLILTINLFPPPDLITWQRCDDEG